MYHSCVVDGGSGVRPRRAARRLAGRALPAAVTAAVVASLLAAAATAEEIKPGDDNEAEPSYTTGQSACVGDAAIDQGFVDVPADHPFKAAIDCLAYYDITTGTGDGTTFAPDTAITGVSMAKFMERTARVAGVDRDAVVGDFDTAEPVTRADVAVLVARLLVAVTGEDSDPNIEMDDIGTVTINEKVPDDWFADARDTQPLPVDSAISALYELGVTEGRPDGSFAPQELATRAEAAELITGALGRTRVRPEGVTIQQHISGDVVVSARDADFAPVEGVAIDVFSVSTRFVDTSAFKSDGTCGAVRVPQGGDSGSRCTIASTDPTTGEDGDLVLQVDIDKRGGTTVWAWTGEEDDRVTGGGAGLARVDLTDAGPVVAEGAKVTHDIPGGAHWRRFGDAVTVTVQLTGAGGRNAVRPRDGAAYRVEVWAYRVRDSGTPVPAGGASGIIVRDPSDELAFIVYGYPPNRPLTRSTQHGRVDSTGKLTFTVAAVSPIPDDTGMLQVVYEVTKGPDNDLDPPTGGKCLEAGQATETVQRCPVFSGQEPRVEKVEVTTPVTYAPTPARGASSPMVATIAVTDQYGAPMRGVKVMLTSSLDDRDPDVLERLDRARSTRRDGRVRISYLYRSSESAVETLGARLPGPDGVYEDDPDTPDVNESDDNIMLSDPPYLDGTIVYWMEEPDPSFTDGNGAPVLSSRVDENTIIVDTDPSGDEAPARISYDLHDHLYHNGQPVTLEYFKDQLAGWEEDIADGTATESVPRFRLVWRYLNSASGIAQLRLNPY